MNNTLTDKEVKRISQLNKLISKDFACKIDYDITKWICSTCRLDAVELMKEYLQIHNYEVIKK